jgi:signal transduction histidine kinase
MTLLLAFSPFAAFAIVERLFGVVDGLGAGAFVAAILLLRDAISAQRKVKLLEIGTTLLFAALAIYAVVFDVQWSVAAVRLRVDAGLAFVVLASIALRQPFTLQYARETLSRDRLDSPRFLRVNYVISAAWAVAFTVLALADALMEYVPAVPRSAGIALTIVAIIAAMKFTRWYPVRDTERPT